MYLYRNPPCRERDAAVIHHKLRMLILKHLAVHALTGYSLINEIKEHTGWKPSYGSVYPQLEQLRKEGLVTFTQDGRRKIFTLTPQGTRAHAELKGHRKELIEKIRETKKLMTHLCGMKDDPLAERILDSFERNDPTYKGILQDGWELRAQIARLMNGKHEKAIRTILQETTAKLKRLS